MTREPLENTATVARSSGESCSMISEQARLALSSLGPSIEPELSSKMPRLSGRVFMPRPGESSSRMVCKKVAARGAKLFIF